MSRMFHRVLAASVVGVAALAVPGTALAAASSGGGGGGATPTSVAIHLPTHVRPGAPVTVTARITPQDTAREPVTAQPGGHRGKGAGGTGGGKGTAKGGGHRKGAGHGSGSGTGSGHGHGKGKARHQAVGGEVRFFLDGKAEPPVEVNRDQASEQLRIPLGRHTLLAEYSGDAEHLAARSAPVSFELAPGQDGPGLGNPGQDEGPGQGPDGLGSDWPDGTDTPDAPDAPDQGTGQYGPGWGDQGQDVPGLGQGGGWEAPEGAGRAAV